MNLTWSEVASGFLDIMKEAPDLSVASVKHVARGAEHEDAGMRQREPDAPRKFPLFSIAINRPMDIAMDGSARTINADAARRVFDIGCQDITWAVIDSGIDARHPAFEYHGPLDIFRPPFRWLQVKPGYYVRTRVIKTLDFTKLISARYFLEISDDPLEDLTADVSDESLHYAMERGGRLDWEVVERVIDVPYDDKGADGTAHLAQSLYSPPALAHGTHVAGILAADWREPPNARGSQRGRTIRMQGICPDITLYDLRVFDKDCQTSEFILITALEYVAHLSSNRKGFAIHGVNISLSIRHDVTNYACGRTPVCEACARLVESGVVVVAAAGNYGFDSEYGAYTHGRGYRAISITDPGNAEDVITVGATHRDAPHTYGVSYFSSRGPTGDGRLKPDLVAPGEKIVGPVGADEQRAMDGTSMAAPHVSGAAALLIARHRELAGDPRRIKQILCQSAIDLGRERNFQGHGLVDALHAINSF